MADTRTSRGVLFLDFDGVIRMPVLGTGFPPECEFSEDCLKRVGGLIEASGFQVVISSDWRHRHDQEKLLTYLRPWVTAEHLHPDWGTPDLRDAYPDIQVPRKQEIQAWLEGHPEVSRFLILDDLGRNHFAELEIHLVPCSLEVGLSELLFNKAVAMLGQQSNG